MVLVERDLDVVVDGGRVGEWDEALAQPEQTGVDGTPRGPVVLVEVELFERPDLVAAAVADGRPAYQCTNCGYELEVGSTKNLRPCPSCHNGQYTTRTGGDAADDPYPDRS